MLPAVLLAAKEAHAKFYSCPEFIEIPEVKPPKGFEVWNDPADKYHPSTAVTSITLYNGPPFSMQNIIKPDNDDATGDDFFLQEMSGRHVIESRWTLHDSAQDFWMACKYLPWGKGLLRKLDRSVKSCETEHSGTGGDHMTIALICK